MFCNKCGTENEDKNNFCKNCGQTLKSNLGADDQHQTIFDNSYQDQSKTRTDLGYLILALMVLFNILIFVLWSLFGQHIMSQDMNLVKIIRVVSAMFSVGQFVVMFMFTKKQSYRVVIVVVGLIVACSQIYSFFRY